MPCEKHDPRASVTTITSAFGLGFCLLSPSGHVFHTAWEPMIKSYSIDWLASQIIDINSFQTQAHPINLIDYAACVECKCSKTNASLVSMHRTLEVATDTDPLLLNRIPGCEIWDKVCHCLHGTYLYRYKDDMSCQCGWSQKCKNV